MDLETISAILFVIILCAVLFLERKKLHLQKVLFPAIYVLLYKTKVGLKLMDKVSARAPRAVRYFGITAIVLGFIGMAVVSYSLIDNLLTVLFVSPQASAVALVLPVKVKGTFFVPFFYWIISLFFLVIVHEFSHGMVSRRYGIPVKSSGLAFLGLFIPLIPAAFVEPDEKILRKKSAIEQLSVFAAGSFANFVLAGIAILLLVFAVNPAVNAAIDYSGVRVSGVIRGNSNESLAAEAAGISEGEIITSVDGIPVLVAENLSAILAAKNPGDNILVTTNESSYSFALSQNPKNSSMAYMGLQLSQHTRMNPGFGERYGKSAFSILMWISGLVMWLYILNLGIGMFNLLPLPICDGGRMFFVAASSLFEQRRAQMIWHAVSLLFVIVIVVNLGAGFFK
ncbi:MAG TPA: site-2 protease family protein [Candidatus Nanoarchaeia archaeon]|nr:site-2 protease family protein [Candidatus Nanoarchaeia archaeon]